MEQGTAAFCRFEMPRKILDKENVVSMEKMGKRRKLVTAWLLVLSMTAPMLPPIMQSQAADTETSDTKTADIEIETDYDSMTITEI